MDIKITPSHLSGKIRAVSSKSDAHRKIIAAMLSGVDTTIEITEYSADIDATLMAVKSLGGSFEKNCDGVLISPGKYVENAHIDCGESGSTARFLLPVAAVVSKEAVFTGCGRLPNRPFSELVRELRRNGAEIDSDTIPLKVSGNLKSGTYSLPGNVSSQYISGLMFALALLCGKSEIIITSPLESSAYVDMTVRTLEEFGVEVVREDNKFIIFPQKYMSKGRYTVEGDWSNAAFWIVADKLCGGVEVEGLDSSSVQGDKKILDLLGADEIDASQIPDLVPVLSILACGRNGKTVIKNAARLRLKESDRLSAMVSVITSLGGEAYADSDSLTVIGTGRLKGGTVDGMGDHRIVMSAAIASCICENDVTIRGIEAVEKSYPSFFEDFKGLGGVFDVI